MCTAELCVCVCVCVCKMIMDMIMLYCDYSYHTKNVNTALNITNFLRWTFLVHSLLYRIYEYIFYNTNSVIYLCTSIFYFSPLFTIILLSKIIWNPIYASAKCTITFKITESNGRMSFASIVNIMFLPLLHHFYSSFLSYF